MEGGASEGLPIDGRVVDAVGLSEEDPETLFAKDGGADGGLDGSTVGASKGISDGVFEGLNEGSIEGLDDGTDAADTTVTEWPEKKNIDREKRPKVPRQRRRTDMDRAMSRTVE